MMRVAHISSTLYGGGVTELLTPPTLMMNVTGIDIVLVRISSSRVHKTKPSEPIK
jgi:hypothetical protein